MATARQFEELGVWQEARQMVREIYRVTSQRAFRRDSNLCDQITRAATSTMSNIAEGFERGSRKEFVQFLNIAKGSNGEVRSQLYVAIDQQYIDEKTFNDLKDSALKLSRRVAKFISYLQSYPSNARVRSARER